VPGLGLRWPSRLVATAAANCLTKETLGSALLLTLARTTLTLVNAVLAAAGYNFRRLLAWLRFCLGQNPDCVQPTHPAQIRLKSGSSRSTK
jgi:hypothetical protein